MPMNIKQDIKMEFYIKYTTACVLCLSILECVIKALTIMDTLTSICYCFRMCGDLFLLWIKKKLETPSYKTAANCVVTSGLI